MKFTINRASAVLLVLCTNVILSMAQPQPDAHEETYQQFNRLAALKQYADALALGITLLERPRTADDVFLRVVQIAKNADRLNELQAYLETRLQKRPYDARFHYALGLLHREQGDGAAALAQQRECLRHLPEFSAAIVALMAFDNTWNAPIEIILTEMSQHNPQSPNAHLGRGLYLRKQGKTEAALAAFAEALSLQPAFPEACYQQALTLNQSGRVADSLAAQRACLLHSEKDVSLKQRRDFASLEVNNLARSEQTEAALAKLEQAWQLSQALGDENYRSVYDFYQGTLNQQKGDYARALQAHQRALERSRQGDSLGEQINAGRLYGQIGRDYFYLGEYDLAEKNYRQGLAYAERLKQRNNQALVHGFLGDLWIARSNLSAAAAAYQQAIQLSSGSGTLNEQNFHASALSRLYLRSGELQKAEEIIQQALHNGRTTGVSVIILSALDNLGELKLRRAQAEAARASYAELLTEAQARANWQFEWQAHAGLARAYEMAGESAAAREHYRQAIQVLESMRARLGTPEQKIGFFQDKIEVYKKLIVILRNLPPVAGAPNGAAQAFHIAERARARALLESLGEIAVFDQVIAPDALRERRELQARFSQLEAELSNAQAAQPRELEKLNALQTALRQIGEQLSQWQQRLRQDQPRYASLRYPAPLQVEQVQQLLKQK